MCLFLAFIFFFFFSKFCAALLKSHTHTHTHTHTSQKKKRVKLHIRISGCIESCVHTTTTPKKKKNHSPNARCGAFFFCFSFLFPTGAKPALVANDSSANIRTDFLLFSSLFFRVCVCVPMFVLFFFYSSQMHVKSCMCRTALLLFAVKITLSDLSSLN